MPDGAGGFLGSLGALGGPMSFLSGPWGGVLGGLGSLFGGNKSLKYFDQARGDIQGLPGMAGPSNLMGDFGASVNGQFGFNPQMGGANQMISQSLGGMLQGQNPFANVDVMNQYGGAINALSQQADPFNQLSSGAAGQLFGQGQANLANASNQQGLYNQSLDVMRQAYAPEQQRQQTKLFDDLFAKGLLGGGTDTGSQNAYLRTFNEAQAQADLGFQNQAFDRSFGQQQFLGNLGMGQIGQGLGAENQAFSQALASLGQNQQAGMNRLGAAQGLFGLGSELQNQRYGLGLQGAESLLGYGDFGLRGAALPYQLQAGLLQGGGYHAQALAGLGQAQADSSAGFFGSLFS